MPSMSAIADQHVDDLIKKNPNLRLSRARTLYAISRFTPDRTGSCYAGDGTLAAAACCSERTMRRAIFWLLENDFIERARSSGGCGRGRNANEYRIVGFNDQPVKMAGCSPGPTGQNGRTNRPKTTAL